jgi:glycosyltransferase involved in cell wall biosynthesis
MADKVSVIIPAYNCAKYIERCVNSIITQSYKNIEIIIVDDGSNDGKTHDIVEKYKSEYEIVQVIHKVNEGSMKAREDGVSLAEGQYIMFVDDDDYLEKDIIEKCVGDIEASKVDIVCFDYCLNEDTERKIFNITDKEVIDNETALRNMLLMKKLDGNMWCKLYRKSLFEGVAFEDRRCCDFVTEAEIICKANFISIIPELGYHYSVIEGSQSRNNICHPREEEYEQAAYELYERFSSNDTLRKAAQYYWLYTVLYVCIKMEKDTQIPRNSERFRNIKKKLRKGIGSYCSNPNSNNKNKIQYLMCYFNFFRPMYRLAKYIRG